MRALLRWAAEPRAAERRVFSLWGDSSKAGSRFWRDSDPGETLVFGENLDLVRLSLFFEGLSVASSQAECTGKAAVNKGPPEYCQDGTVTHLNYGRPL